MLSHLFAGQPAATPPAGLRVGFGTKINPVIQLDDAMLATHVVLSGYVARGVSVLSEQLLVQQTEKGRGWIYFDANSNQALLERLQTAAMDSGRAGEFFVIDLDNPATSNTYALLRDGDSSAIVARLMQLLPPNKSADSFYTAQTGSILLSLYEAAQDAGRAIGLFDLLQIIESKRFEDVVSELSAALPAACPARIKLNVAFAPYLVDGRIDANMVLAVMREFVTQLRNVCGSLPVRSIVDATEPEVSFPDILAHNKMCYVRLSNIAKDAVHLAWARMILRDIIAAFHSRTHAPTRGRSLFMVMLGAFPSYGVQGAASGAGALPAFAYAQARGMGIGIVPVVDASIWSHPAFHVDDIQAVIGNTRTKICFGQLNSPVLRSAHEGLQKHDLQPLTVGEFVMACGDRAEYGRLAPIDVTCIPANRASLAAKPRFPRQVRLLSVQTEGALS